MQLTVVGRVRAHTAGVVLALLALGLSLTASPCLGEATQVGAVRVYSDAEAALFITRDGGNASISFPGARPWVLLDEGGPYSPVAAGDVVEALESITYPLDRIGASVVILPLPRRDLLDSSTEGRVVFLSPGRSEIAREHIHYTVAHEVGHLVHNVLMPDSREDLWKEFARLRGLDFADARDARAHALRLHEVFAEDFRVLFGSDLADCGSGVENHDLPAPDGVPGLRDFFVALATGSGPAIAVAVWPNPFSERLEIEPLLSGNAPAVDGIEIFDVTGRMVAAFKPIPAPGVITWDGRSASGSPVPPGIYFLVVRAGDWAQARKIARISD
jgi:hypothetical protein